MTAFDGSGALGLIGQNPIPQGTPDELRREGVDLANVASCAPRSPGVRGCGVWADCPFNLAMYGGFKGNGRKYVGYYLRTHEGSQKQDFIACDGFVRTLLSRQRAGNAAMAEGKAHEIVRVIAQEEGTTVIAQNGKPWPTTVLQRPGLPVNPDNHNINAPYEMKTLKVVVPRMPRPGESVQSNYDNELWKEEQQRRKADPAFQTGAPPMDLNETDEPFFSENADEESTLDLGVTATPEVVAEPVPVRKAK